MRTHNGGNEGEDLVNMLFETSVLGVRPRNRGVIQFKAEIPDLLRPTEGTVYVHPSLHSALRLH